MPRIFCLAVVLTISLVPTAKAEPILLCGADTVFVVETATATKGKIEKTWSWNAKQCDELPEAVRRSFTNTDDCKPTDGGSRILISSSSGGCALVDRPSGKVIWYAQVPNAHSLELLPHARIVVASSVKANGNRLVLFDVSRSNQSIWDTPLPSAHGVVWDKGRQLLWALGFKELRCYELKDWESEKPSLAIKASYPLPDEDGHDLQPIPLSNDLVVTTVHHAYLFDQDKREFRLHPDLGDTANVKSVNVHPVTGQTAFIQASDKAWWSDSLGLLSPVGTIQLPGERMYKARWLAAANLAFDTYSGYFVSNTFEPDATESYLIVTDQKRFDKVFGVAMVMGDTSHRLPKDAFNSLMVVAAIKRGSAVVEYKVEGVTVKDGVVELRYTTTSKKSDTATFACPLIVSIPKGEYTAVQFVENGKAVKTVTIGENSEPQAKAPIPAGKAAVQQREVYFSGRVQGVGFRQTTSTLAKQFAVTGFVKNLPDGRVQLVVEGQPKEIESFLAAIRKEMGRNITNTEEKTSPATGEFQGFGIRL